MRSPPLSERQELILRAVVEDHIDTAEPVGSKAICGRRGLTASPATIRNEMSNLERMGYLEQPHTSAGRIPSDAGYRYYVDLILGETRLPEDQARVIERILGGKMRQVETLLEAVADVLSSTSSLISIVLGPQISTASLSRIEVARVDPGRAILVLFSDAGFVEGKVVDLAEGMDAAGLERMVGLINGLLQGQTWEQLCRPGALRDLRSALSGYEAVLDDTIEFLRVSLEPPAPDRIYIGGVANLVDLPEFRDRNKTRAVLGFLDRRQAVSSALLARLGRQGVTVTIGRENPQAEMADCSLVSAPYHAAGALAGGVAVLGPRRMDYGLILSLVECVAANLDELLGHPA